VIPAKTGDRANASMTLLTEIMNHPMDPGYVAAAHRRSALGQAAPRARAVVALATALALGFVLTVSALTLRRPVTGAAKVRATLIERIEAQRAHDDQVGTTIAEVEAEIERYQEAALGQTGFESLQITLNQLSLATGGGALTGPGITLTIDDAVESGNDTGSDPRSGQAFSSGRVTARDMQIIVNGLWLSGAEAISINGQRLTSRSAIRFAGSAILVDFRPMTRPYVVTVLGDPQTMQARFADLSAGGFLSSLVVNYAVRADIAASTSLTVPRAALAGLSWATVLKPSQTSGG
jgi:uncharacterized protein YlxW (UPF0749 family)